MKYKAERYKLICKNCGEIYFDYEGSDVLDQIVTECSKCGSRVLEKRDLNFIDTAKMKFKKMLKPKKQLLYIEKLSDKLIEA